MSTNKGAAVPTSTIPAPLQAPRLVWLDAWRVVAASLVFLTHYKPISGQYHWLADEGHLGVTIFFIISGIVIYHKAGEAQASGNWRRFYIHRLGKIYILHTLVYLASLPLLPWRGGWAIAANLTLTKGLFPSLLFTGLPQSWSLTAELCLYALAPFLYRLATPRSDLGQLRNVGLVFLWTACLLFMGEFLSIYTALGRGLAFFVGMQTTYRLALHRQLTGTPKTWGWPLWLLLPACIAGTMAVLWAAGALAPAGLHTAVTDGPAGGFMAAGWCALAMSFLVFFSSWAEPASEGMARLISRAGKASYAFYLIHIGPIAQALFAASGRSVLLTFFLLWIAAYLISRFIENLLLRYLHNISSST